MRNDQRVKSASSFNHKHKSRNLSSNSSAISLSLSGRSGCSDQPGPPCCQNFTFGVTLDFTDYMRRPWSQVEESPFFSSSPQQQQTLQQLTADSLLFTAACYVKRKTDDRQQLSNRGNTNTNTRTPTTTILVRGRNAEKEEKLK